MKAKYNLSGIYIFETTDGHREPTCVEDCRNETQEKWLWSNIDPKQNPQWEQFGKNVLTHLYDTMLDIFENAPIDWQCEGQKKEMIAEFKRRKERDLEDCQCTAPTFLYQNCLRACDKLHQIGEVLGIKKG